MSSVARDAIPIEEPVSLSPTRRALCIAPPNLGAESLRLGVLAASVGPASSANRAQVQWTRQLESDPAEDYRLVAIDLRRHGLSDKAA